MGRLGSWTTPHPTRSSAFPATTTPLENVVSANYRIESFVADQWRRRHGAENNLRSVYPSKSDTVGLESGAICARSSPPSLHVGTCALRARREASIADFASRSTRGSTCRSTRAGRLPRMHDSSARTIRELIDGRQGGLSGRSCREVNASCLY